MYVCWGVIRERAENSKRGRVRIKKLEKRQRGEGVGKQGKQAANVDGRKKLARCHPFTRCAKADWRPCADDRRVNAPKKGTGIIWLKLANERVFFSCGWYTANIIHMGAFEREVRTRIKKKKMTNPSAMHGYDGTAAMRMELRYENVERLTGISTYRSITTRLKANRKYRPR